VDWDQAGSPLKPTVWDLLDGQSCFSEDKEGPLGGAGFNPQDCAHGNAVAVEFGKDGEELGLKGLLGQEEIHPGLKDWGQSFCL